MENLLILEEAMTGMEQETLDAIAKSDDSLHYYLIAQELRISAHYAWVICKGLERGGYVDFDTFKGICSLTKKGKETIEKNWLFKLKRQKENKERILKNVETINY